MWSPLWNTLKRRSEARAKSFGITSPSTRVHAVRNLPLTAGYSALIFTETLITKTGVIAAFSDKPRHLLQNVLEPLLLKMLTIFLPLFFMLIEGDERPRNIQHCVEYSLQLAR